MHTFLKSFFFVVFLCIGSFSYAQYSISGYLDTPDKPKRVFLSLLKFNELYTISKEQILNSTLTDSLGYFSFSGSLLSNKHALYRIYTNIEEGIDGVEKYDTPELKNYHNFIFSNTDTIVFTKNRKYWFSSNKNTNPVDKEWGTFGAYANKLRNEYLDLSNKEYSNQSSAQFLVALKSYAVEKKPHPLTLLILLENIPKSALQKDVIEDAKFYEALQDNLNSYYDNSFYALQFYNFLQDLNKEQTRKDLKFYRNFTFIVSSICMVLLATLLIVLKKLKHTRNSSNTAVDTSLTKQEKKVAKLICDNKTNKEIASELFISLNTVKTHVRNVYAKLEVNNRSEFVAKYKNHP